METTFSVKTDKVGLAASCLALEQQLQLQNGGQVSWLH
jgi:hypothetical protein